MRSLARLAFALLLLSPPLAAAAQPDPAWWPRADLNAALPSSIRVFEASAASGLRAWYVEADPSDTSWVVRAVPSDAPGGVETVASFARDADALVAVNAGYFGGGQSFSLVAEDGVVHAPNIAALNRDGATFYPTRGAFAVLADGTPDVAWVYDVGGTTYAYPRPSDNAAGSPRMRPNASFPAGGAPWPLGTGVGGGPVLVEDGRARITWEEEVFFGSGVPRDTRRARTAVGYTADGRLLLLVAGEGGGGAGLTLPETAALLIDLGAVEALNLDGGGSSGLVVGETGLVATGRAVASALVLAPRPADPPTGGEILRDTGDACCYRERGGWFESANTPYHGGTPARLNEVGTGEDRATFVLDGLAGGVYEVAAWWVPAGNRARDTPYTVYHRGAGRTVRVDQRDAATAGRWNALGTFTLASGDSVVVSDDASGTASPAFVVADALRLVRVSGVAAERRAAGAGVGFSLYPNPASDRVTLVAEGGTRGAVEVVDVLGRTVLRATIGDREGPHVLPVDGLAAGVYLVRVTRPGATALRTFTVAR